jgi:mono/diheme cytochrome c family protein
MKVGNMQSAYLLVLAALGLTVSAAASAQSDTEAYRASCQACHQPTGLGIQGAFPALKGSPVATGAQLGAITRVLKGKGAMPAFERQLSDAQIAAALTYVRRSWGNRASPVTAADVAAARAGQKREMTGIGHLHQP